MDLTSYLLGKNSSSGGGGGGGDLSEYFNTEITSNTTYPSYVTNEYIIKKMPPFKCSSEITNLSYCFSKYNNIPMLDVSQMDTSNVTNMEGMFTELTSVNEIDASNFNTAKVNNYNYLFYMSKVKKINLSSFTTKQYANMNYMFANTNNLTILDISNFEFSNGGSFGNMFYTCGSSCLQSDGAYADGIPYIYVKNATEQNWILTQSNGHPSSWTTDNVVIKS